MVGMMEVFLINAALHRLWQSGEGQYIDLSVAEATTMLLPEAILDYSMNQRAPQPQGNRHPSYAPHGNYPCRGQDQWIGIAVATDQQWSALCEVLQCRELLDDPRFSDALERRRNQDTLDPLIAAGTREWDGLELTERLQKAGVPAGPALSVGQLWENPHLRERGFFQKYCEEDEAGTRRELPGVPWRFNGAVEARLSGQPRRGQHNSYVFDELLGLDPAKVAELQEQEIIY
jgi:crotonobetainyl-CoA:carnitine CoA-transferase CaiB-like acyl-CoA transferase